jgi:CheY-like chemotaxis protein
MPKRVLDVGNCQPDHAAIRRLIQSHFDADVVRAHGWSDATAELLKGGIDLVLVNRRLDRDHSDGIELIRQIRTDARMGTMPCMLISNHPEYQAQAEQAGAERGFGKSELDQEETLEKLRQHLA